MNNKPKPVSIFFRILSIVLMFFFTKIFRIKANISSEIRKLRGPYLLLVNHVGFWDPFVTSYFLNKKPHFVSSDAVLKDPVKRFFLIGFGVIPKKKNVKDTQVIRTMAEYINAGEAVGLFPEGSRTWYGETMGVDDSIGKLAKLLGVPVVTARLKGMFLFNPRWAYKIRKTKVEIDFEIIADKETIKTTSSKDLANNIRKGIYQNEMQWQKTKKHKIHFNRRAEYLNHVLFACPDCGSFVGFKAIQNKMACVNCDFSFEVDVYNFFKLNKDLKIAYSDIAEAFDWQKKTFHSFITEKYNENSEEFLFQDKNVLIYEENSKAEFDFLGKAIIKFYTNRIEVEFEKGEKKVFLLSDIATLNPQFHERIEIFYKDKAYRWVGEEKGMAGVKWEMACNTIWQLTKQEYKISSYFKS